MSAKIALVTGANRGIGKEIVRQLASKGLKVYLAGRDRKKAEAAAAEMQNAGQIVAIELDVSKRESVERAAAEVGNNDGQLDILVNNAGLNLHATDCAVLELPEAVLGRVLDTNLYGPLRCAQAFAPLLKKSAAGRIVNVSSQMGLLHDMQSGYPSYRISKTALNALTRILSAEFQPNRVAVNSMCPGWVRTDMGGENAPRTVAQGADTAIYLALEIEQEASGNFYLDRKIMNW